MVLARASLKFQKKLIIILMMISSDFKPEES